MVQYGLWTVAQSKVGGCDLDGDADGELIEVARRIEVLLPLEAEL